MRHSLNWLPALGASVLLVTGAFAAPPGPVAVPIATVAVPPPRSNDPADGQELQNLVARLGSLGDFISRNAQSPEIWRSYLEQGDLLLQLAMRSEAKERDNLLRMAIESLYGAAVGSPGTEEAGYQRLHALPGQLAQLVPGHAVIAYSARQVIQAEYMRLLDKSGKNPEQAQGQLCQRLVQYAQEYPQAPDATSAVVEAARLNESLGRTQEARSCYRYLIDAFPGNPLARKARGAMWRLGQDGEPVQLELPLLYSACDADAPLSDLTQFRGRVVVVYFWSSTTPQATQDFPILKHLTDRTQDQLEVVYVNMDNDPGQGRAFLSGQLTAGTHLYQHGGLDGPIAERYGIQTLPQALLLGRDGLLIRHSLQASQIEALVSGQQQR